MAETRRATVKKAPTEEPAKTPGMRPLIGVMLAVVGFVVLVGLGGWLAWTALDRPLAQTPDRAELVALDQRLTNIDNQIKPIAAAFTSEPATGLIDVSDYRARIASVRRYVDDTNGLSVTSPDAIEVRDLIITGGSEVLDGMSIALDALQSDEASATQPAAEQVDEGLATLQDARDKLDALLENKTAT
jgi:hypothetical protein